MKFYLYQALSLIGNSKSYFFRKLNSINKKVTKYYKNWEILWKIGKYYEKLGNIKIGKYYEKLGNIVKIGKYYEKFGNIIKNWEIL